MELESSSSRFTGTVSPPLKLPPRSPAT
jgi:hypothetical protein